VQSFPADLCFDFTGEKESTKSIGMKLEILKTQWTQIEPNIAFIDFRWTFWSTKINLKACAQ
jgi:hypothetical protein